MKITIPEDVITRALQQEYFNKGAAAQVLGVSRSTFQNWCKIYDFKPISIDGQILYSKKNLIKFMEAHQI